jgi:hypothetical protein
MRLLPIAITLGLSGCNGGTSSLGGAPWPAADDLFHQDPKWLGGDLGSTIDLGDDRTLWLFGDTYIATTSLYTRRESTIVHNTIGVMFGHHPALATMDFTWARGPEPGAWIPDASDRFFWPISGTRIAGGPLVIFVAEVQPTPIGPQIVGTRAIRIADPSGPAYRWAIEPLELPPPAFSPDAEVGSCVVVDGDHLVAVSVEHAPHVGRLVRWPLAGIASGDLATREWWTGDDWVAEAALVDTPKAVFDFANPQCSFSFGYSRSQSHEGKTWLYLQGGVAAFESTRLEGPYEPEGFIYYIEGQDSFNKAPYPAMRSAQEHPALDAENYLSLVTYVPTALQPEDLTDPALEHELYWPHFLRLLEIETGVE